MFKIIDYYATAVHKRPIICRVTEMTGNRMVAVCDDPELKTWYPHSFFSDQEGQKCQRGWDWIRDPESLVQTAATLPYYTKQQV